MKQHQHSNRTLRALASHPIASVNVYAAYLVHFNPCLANWASAGIALDLHPPARVGWGTIQASDYWLGCNHSQERDVGALQHPGKDGDPPKEAWPAEEVATEGDHGLL